MLISAILATIRGFSREIFSIMSWVGALLAAFFLYKPLLPFVQDLNFIPKNETVQIIITALAIFLVVLILLSYLTMLLADAIVDSRIGVLDRTLGFIFGAARGALLVVVALWGFQRLAGDSEPEWVTTAKSKPALESVGQMIEDALPDDIIAMLKRSLDQQEPDGSGGEADSDA